MALVLLLCWEFTGYWLEVECSFLIFDFKQLGNLNECFLFEKLSGFYINYCLQILKNDA